MWWMVIGVAKSDRQFGEIKFKINFLGISYIVKATCGPFY